jgi:hypothetical protein
MVAMLFCCPMLHAQAALLMEEPYGFFGQVNPTGHNALYLARICAETPVQLRRCAPDELGVVIARYQGIADYDWVAIPLIPYLYSVEKASDAPAEVDRATVNRLRNRYHEAHLLSLGEEVPAGSLIHGGWKELVGASYERRIYAFRFQTTEEQDDALIARLNGATNHSHFELFYSNCSDFSRLLLDFYLPGNFHRSIFPDAGITTPKQTARKLVRYARKHPELQLEIFEIPQIPGYRRHSHSNHGVAESLSTTGYVLPIALVNPYLAGGLLADYLVRGRFHLIPRNPPQLGPENIFLLGKFNQVLLTNPALSTENDDRSPESLSAPSQNSSIMIDSSITSNSTLKRMKESHE